MAHFKNILKEPSIVQRGGVAASVVLLHHKTQAILFLSDYTLNAKTHFWRLLPGT